MSDGVYDDYEDLPLSAAAPGRLSGWPADRLVLSARVLPGAVIAASSVLFGLWVAHRGPAIAPLEGASAPKINSVANANSAAKSDRARPAVASAFGSLALSRDLLRLESASPSEVGRFGSLAPIGSPPPSTAPAVASSGRFALDDAYGMADDSLSEPRDCHADAVRRAQGQVNDAMDRAAIYGSGYYRY